MPAESVMDRGVSQAGCSGAQWVSLPVTGEGVAGQGGRTSRQPCLASCPTIASHSPVSAALAQKARGWASAQAWPALELGPI